jgi:orotate phosphoribosyltransferase
VGKKKSGATPLMFYSSYGWTSLSPRKMAERMQQATEDIIALKKKLNFQALAFTGSSGAAIAFIVGMAAQIPIIYVRKKNESHHGNRIESNTQAPICSYLIVDDFTATGETVRSIYNAIQAVTKEYNRKEPICKGVYFFDYSYRFTTKLQMNDDTVLDIYNRTL